MKFRMLIAVFAVSILAALGGFGWTGSNAGEFALAEYSVQNLSCGSCVQNIQKALSGKKGIGEVEVSVTAGRARVEYIPAIVDGGTIAEHITEAGYPAALTRKLSVVDYRAFLEDSSGLADRFVGRIGERLISREEFSEALSRFETEAAVPQQGLLMTIWNGILQREILLAAAEENGVVIQPGEVDLRLQKMRQTNINFEAFVKSRYGNEVNFRRWLKGEMIIRRNIEEHVLQGESEAGRRQLTLDRWFEKRVATVPVVIFDTALKTAVEGGGKGCGGSCCG